MKNRVNVLLLLLSIISFPAYSQSQDSSDTDRSWSGGADLNFYFMKDDFFLMPVVKADKGWLHLEARYNYESEETFSLWGGYNFSGGNKLEYLITPMAGFVAGDITGIAPGLEMTLGFHSFEFYSESEYYVDFNERENDFLYTWTELTWSPFEWLWVGISGQRSRLYDTEFDIQRGIVAGGGYKSWELSGYMYNPGSEDLFFITTLSWSF